MDGPLDLERTDGEDERADVDPWEGRTSQLERSDDFGKYKHSAISIICFFGA